MASTSGLAENKKGRGIWLVGGMLEKITGCKLPSNQQVLGRYFYNHLVGKESIQSSATKTAREICLFWEKARIPTRKECHVIDKIRKLHMEWKNLLKSSTRRTPQQQQKENDFVSVLDDLFDIAHADALVLITIAEDREFLLAQREKGRRGCMGPVDTKLARKEERSRKRQIQTESRKMKELERTKIANVNVECTQIDSDEDQSSSSETYEISVKNPKINASSSAVNILKTKSIVTSEVASALDRTGVSDRNAVYILSAAAQSLGHNSKDFTLNRESVRNARREYREKIATELKTSFAPIVPLTIHWDGKLLPGLLSKKKVDRLAVIVSGAGVMKLLGVPKIPNGTGATQAAAIYRLLEEWSLTKRIQCMCFDTTASNSGSKAGACVLLEKTVKRDLLNLACRHHIMELIIESVFNALMGASSGPNISIFQRFSDNWDTIDKQKFEWGIKEDFVAEQINPLKDDLANFMKEQLSNFQPRDDYKELLQLALLFLGDNSAKQFKINAPGALHRARWMAKIIYSIKIYLFRSQFKLTTRELSNLRAFNVFVIQIYLKYWFTSPCAVSAPKNDLALLKELYKYRGINKTVADAAVKSFERHLWYLNDKNIGFAFFDLNVSCEIKTKMVNALKNKSGEDNLRRIKIEPEVVQKKQLWDFVSQNTLKVFENLEISQNFLNSDPNTWEANIDFIEGRKRIQNLKVVNDAAERGISLIQSFNGIITNQEEQKQYLLQVIEKHRKDFPNSNKSTIII